MESKKRPDRLDVLSLAFQYCLCDVVHRSEVNELRPNLWLAGEDSTGMPCTRIYGTLSYQYVAIALVVVKFKKVSSPVDAGSILGITFPRFRDRKAQLERVVKEVAGKRWSNRESQWDLRCL